MFKKTLSTAILMSSIFTYSSVQAEMTESDKKLMVGTLYLSQCALKDSDFRKASEAFDMRYLKTVPSKGPEKSQYIDGWAKARITLKENLCLVEIKSKEIDKMASSLPKILETAGGKLSLKKIDGRYEGTLIQNDKTIEVEANQSPQDPNIMMIGLFTK